MKVKIKRVCKDCGATVKRGPKGGKFEFGCPNCGNKATDRVKKVKRKKTEPERRVCLACGDVVIRDDENTFYCPQCGTSGLEQIKLAEKVIRKTKGPVGCFIRAAMVPACGSLDTVTKAQASAIFEEWWQPGVLKVELKPEKVLRVIYAMIEENQDELRLKVVALCKLANGEKRRMVALRYQRRGADKPHHVFVHTTKKPDGDELFDDSPAGRDAFARRLLQDVGDGEERAARWLQEHAEDVAKARKT